MTNRYRNDEELGVALVALGRDLDYPRTPDLARAVAQRLGRDSVLQPAAVLAPFPGMRSVRRAALLAAAVVLLVAGAAVAARFGLRGVEIRLLETPPAVPTAPPGENLALGRPVDLVTAQSGVDYRIRTSEIAVLGTPDGVFLDPLTPGGRVTFTYLPRSGLPRDAITGLGMLVTQFRADPDEDLLVKEAGPGTTVERVTVGDADGFWIEGEPHAVLYRDERGEPLADTIRLAGNVLVWQVGEVTLRLEADISRPEAVRIAESFR